MSFNSKIAIQLLKQAPTHSVHLDALDLEAERQGTALIRASRCIFRGKRLLGKPPSRQSLRTNHY